APASSLLSASFSLIVTLSCRGWLGLSRAGSPLAQSFGTISGEQPILLAAEPLRDPFIRHDRLVPLPTLLHLECFSERIFHRGYDGSLMLLCSFSSSSAP